MLFNQHNLNIAKIADKSGIRPEIATVLFTKDKTVATDSFRLIEMDYPHDMQGQELPTPVMPAIEQPLLANAKDIAKIKIKPNRNLPVMNCGGIKAVNEHDVELSVPTGNDLNMETRHIFLERGQYPDYTPIIPTKEPIASVVVNANFLVDLLQILSKSNPKDTTKVTIAIHDKNEPMVITNSNPNQPARALLMPIIS